MKAHCERCGTLREMDYPASTLNDGAFTIEGTCSACGTHLEQKKKVLLSEMVWGRKLLQHSSWAIAKNENFVS
jgi:hypothetical protein